MLVVLGNRNAIHSFDNGETFEPLPGKLATTIDVPDEYSLVQAFKAITDFGGVWSKQAEEGAVPAWVASESPELATLVSANFGGIEIRELELDHSADPQEG